jgi:hypothetical protein
MRPKKFRARCEQGTASLFGRRVDCDRQSAEGYIVKLRPEAKANLRSFSPRRCQSSAALRRLLEAARLVLPLRPSPKTKHRSDMSACRRSVDSGRRSCAGYVSQNFILVRPIQNGSVEGNLPSDPLFEFPPGLMPAQWRAMSPEGGKSCATPRRAARPSHLATARRAARGRVRAGQRASAWRAHPRP